ncbi:hypothetical protein FSBG_00145 [Fusobacterium gonidiaformans 3-1-5R]|uniref:Uncharacterized protein n=1 Tax=Fusobacterium gonidiaformans 3-1-5R TaxID=469605 RepID=E5BEW7_9FUSO|nr:hypothetical protein [Fusobacterium gonidiaformans]EFS20648.1 hypothetical protein FSBG_00145 [Fusobacterium gonidiaformans 3-1-5R]
MNKKNEIFLICVAIIGMVALAITLGYNLMCLKTPTIIQWILGVCGVVGFVFGYKYI